MSHPSSRPPFAGDLPALDVGRGRLVLHVDDDRDQQQLYTTYLRRAGFRVAQANTGIQGVERAIELHPHLIVMDLLMPFTDGFEATRRLKRLRETHDIPILVITAHANQAPVRLAEEAGANALLVKPVLREELLGKIQAMLG
ncbi:response regulator [Pendulispora albinea]|uniref:Response regulator n=1 Tax=Pendulispora albinea TaxID=2741071 RepID=A0ABZ2MC95_9BACT